MGPAAVILVMLATVGATVLATGIPHRQGLAVIAATALVSLSFLAVGGADLAAAVGGLPPLLLLAGYAALAGVLHAEGFTRSVAQLLGPSPVWVLLAAAAASVLLSNDVVVVAFAAVVLSRPNKLVDAAALFVGANVTGGLLPQGSPTNLLLLPNSTFAGHLAMSAVPTVAMLAAAVVVFTLVGLRRRPRPVGPLARPRSSLRRQGALAVVAVGAIAAQPLSDLAGIERWVVGVVLLAASVVLARAVGRPPLFALRAVPWQIAGVVVVLAAGAAAIRGTFDGEAVSVAWAVNTFVVTALGTDIMAAALAAPEVAAGVQSVAVTRAAITAGAFATPVGSVAGILLLQEYRALGERAHAGTFVLAAGCAVVCLAVGVAAAVWL